MLTPDAGALTKLTQSDRAPLCYKAPMNHSDFKIGTEFLTATGRWRCTDVGTRTIPAIRLDLDHDSAWYNGPPYPVVEHVFDEYGFEDCDPAPQERTFDDSGKASLVTVGRISRQSP
jgi:hypothetical protein